MILSKFKDFFGKWNKIFPKTQEKNSKLKEKTQNSRKKLKTQEKNSIFRHFQDLYKSETCPKNKPVLHLNVAKQNYVFGYFGCK